jgi:hypothetical protein
MTGLVLNTRENDALFILLPEMQAGFGYLNEVEHPVVFHARLYIFCLGEVEEIELT